jgi:hypothetical protein
MMMRKKVLSGLMAIWVFIVAPVAVGMPSNLVKTKHPEQLAIIKNLIFKQLSFYKLRDPLLRPIDAIKYGERVRNPFIRMDPNVSKAMLEEGINFSRMSRYDALYIAGGEINQKLINKFLKTVLVIASDAVINETIYSRGPVVILANAEVKKGIVGESLVWYSKQADYNQDEFDLSFGQPLYVGLPLVAPKNNQKHSVADFIIPELDTLKKFVEQKKARHVSKCRNSYATSAVDQFKEGKVFGCGFTGLRWSEDPKGHAKWCETVPYLFALQETQARDEKLVACKR